MCQFAEHDVTVWEYKFKKNMSVIFLILLLNGTRFRDQVAHRKLPHSIFVT
jgi:hypothetical protein